MEIKVEIPFEQLLTVVKTLSPAQKTQLKNELNEQMSTIEDKAAFINMLLKGPIYTEEEIQVIEKNRKSIVNWRTKR